MDLVKFVSRVRNLKVTMATSGHFRLQNLRGADPRHNVTIYEIWGEEDSADWVGLVVQIGEEKLGTDKLYPNYKTVVKKSSSQIRDLFPFSFFFKLEKKREARSHCS